MDVRQSSATPMVQIPLDLDGAMLARVKERLLQVLGAPQQPSPADLLKEIENALGVRARFELRAAISALIENAALTRSNREYLVWLMDSGELDVALRGEGAPDAAYTSTIDSLLEKSRQYQESKHFQEMIDFMGRFREYSPFNNMLVRVQNPACSFFATESHWAKKFGASLKEDANPMIILAPMRPVLLVYDMDQVEGFARPEELDEFGEFEGDWDSKWLARLVENAERRDRIRINFKRLSATLVGFATVTDGGSTWKRRIAVHDGLNEPSRFGVLCHELGHIFLGHLGTDADHWWPARTNLTKHAVELEAEAVAHLVTCRLGLSGSSASYVSRHLPDGQVPAGVSMEMIAKVAARLEEVAHGKLPVRPPRKVQPKARKTVNVAPIPGGAQRSDLRSTILAP